MARYNKIYAGPATEASPHVHEAKAKVDIMPGSMVTIDADEDFALADPSVSNEVFVAQENYLAMMGVEDAVKVGETVIGMTLMPRQHFRARLSTGNDVRTGDALSLGASGALTKSAAGNRIVGVALETYNNDTGSDQLITFRPASGTVPTA